VYTFDVCKQVIHVLCLCEQPPGMMMSPMMRGVNSAGYYPSPYDVSRLTSFTANHCIQLRDFCSSCQLISI